MANTQQANVLSETRAIATVFSEAFAKLVHLRTRFNSLGGDSGFKGTGKLFAADGSGQEIPYDDFLGIFNALGALEADTEEPAFIAVVERARA